MNRKELTELLAQAIYSHRLEILGWRPGGSVQDCRRALVQANDMLDAISNAGLAVVPNEPTQEMRRMASIWRHNPRECAIRVVDSGDLLQNEEQK